MDQSKLGPLKAHWWRKVATNEQFFELLEELATIYATRQYDEDGTYNLDKLTENTLLFKHYKQYLERKKNDKTSK